MDSKKPILPRWLVDKNYRVRLTDVAKYRKPFIQLDYIKFPIPKQNKTFRSPATS